VPFLLLDQDGRTRLTSGGALRDIAPTLLGILGVAEPAEMTGGDLRIVSK
jgi:2,3-bisphosphoglycerate-independent phosphoglycerate mutase